MLSEHKVYVDAWRHEAVMLFDTPDDTTHYADMLMEAHDVIVQLETELAKCHQANADVASINGDLVMKNKNLESLNAELVEALQFCENVLSGHPLRSSEAKAWQVAYDTLAKARGES